jgi:hypothetical protein
MGHGTHVSGTILARADGDGVVGVLPAGARLFMNNPFGPLDSFNANELLVGWDNCVQHLSYLKKSVNPAMRMVVSMSVNLPASFEIPAGELWRGLPILSACPPLVVGGRPVVHHTARGLGPERRYHARRRSEAVGQTPAGRLTWTGSMPGGTCCSLRRAAMKAGACR